MDRKTIHHLVPLPHLDHYRNRHFSVISHFKRSPILYRKHFKQKGGIFNLWKQFWNSHYIMERVKEMFIYAFTFYIIKFHLTVILRKGAVTYKHLHIARSIFFKQKSMQRHHNRIRDLFHNKQFIIFFHWRCRIWVQNWDTKESSNKNPNAELLSPHILNYVLSRIAKYKNS